MDVRTLTALEKQYFDFLLGRSTLTDFEKWVGATPSLEEELGPNRYFELINLNYRQRHAAYELAKLLQPVIDLGKLEQLKLRAHLQSILERDGREQPALVACYHLYCDGYYFLEDLAFGYALPLLKHLESTATDGARADDVLNDFYPEVAAAAHEIARALDAGLIELYAPDPDGLPKLSFRDHRPAATE